VARLTLRSNIFSPLLEGHLERFSSPYQSFLDARDTNSPPSRRSPLSPSSGQ
jgi:hypothetical protein